MTVTAGALTLVSVASTTATLTSAAATGGTGPYTYQWYRSTTSGFTPGAGNLISGATSLTLSDSGLIPNTPYYYEVIATDSLAAVGDSAQLAVTTTAPSLSPNSFAQSTLVGTMDLRWPVNTVSVQVDLSQTTPIAPGAAVKIVNSSDGVPKVVACAANSDSCVGFLNYDMKSTSLAAGASAEMSMSGNCIYLYATSAISRFTQVQLDVSSPASVTAKVGSSGANVVGFAYDKAAGYGSLIRVVLTAPAFTYA